jgi:hypothetical protein
MRTNQQLLKEYECINSDEDVLFLMKQAQITILEEALAVGYKNNIAMLTGEIQEEPSMEAIILKLIKELEL